MLTAASVVARASELSTCIPGHGGTIKCITPSFAEATGVVDSPPFQLSPPTKRQANSIPYITPIPTVGPLNRAQADCTTTYVPEFPHTIEEITMTVWFTTVTAQVPLNCGGCSLIVNDPFQVGIITTTTTLHGATTTTNYFCAQTNVKRQNECDGHRGC